MRTKLTCVSGISALLSVALLTGCGDDDSSSSPDAASPPDAAAPDASEGPPDASVPTFDPTKKTEELSTGISMTYVEAGNTDGEVVIMLHGYTDTSRSFFPTIESLVASNTQLHIYALDQRGHGGSSMPPAADCAAAPEDCFEMADFVEDVIAFMDAKSITTAHIVGHSLGTLVAQEIALANPDRVESLTLIATMVLGQGNPVLDYLNGQVEGQDDAMGQWRGLLEAGTPGFQWPEDAYELTPMDADPDVVTNFMEPIWVTEFAADPAFLGEIIPETTATKLGTWIGALRNVITFDTQGRLDQLTVPTLVIWATQDSFFLEDPDQTRVLAELDAAIEGCTLPYYFHKTYGKLELPADLVPTDIGHNTQWGAYEAVAADITAWVTTDEPTTDRPFAAGAGTVETEAGMAVIIEKQQANPCTPP